MVWTHAALILLRLLGLEMRNCCFVQISQYPQSLIRNTIAAAHFYQRVRGSGQESLTVKTIPVASRTALAATLALTPLV